MDGNIVDFIKKYNEKQAEKFKGWADRAARLYLTMTLTKIELITNEDPYNEDTIRKVCQCFDIANDEFLANDELMDRYGADEDTPSIQLFLINKLINRTIELFFGESFQAERLQP